MCDKDLTERVERLERLVAKLLDIVVLKADYSLDLDELMKSKTD